MKKWLVLVLLLAGLAVGATIFVSGSRADTQEQPSSKDQLFRVKRGKLPIRLTENGVLVAKDSRKIVVKSRGNAKIAWIAKEGQQVEENAVVCRLDTTSLRTRIDTLENEVLKWETDLKTARTNLDIQELENEGKLETAQDAQKKAEMELEKYRDGDAPQDRRNLEIDLKDAQTEFRRSKKRYEDSKTLLAQEFIKKSELEQHQIEFERAQVQKEGAELALKLWHKYTYPMAIQDKKTAMENAKRELLTVRKRNTSELDQKQAAVKQAVKRLASAKRQMAEKRKELEAMTMQAPCPGILIYGDPREPWRRSEIKVGGQVWGGMTIITIPDLRVMQVRLRIHEADINKVKVGQRATVTMDTYPGLQLEGKVERVASIAGNRNNPWSTSSTVKKFDVEVTITSKIEIKLKPGISAKAEIHIDDIEDAVFVPLQCVFVEDGENFCYAQPPGANAVKQKVEIGQSNDTYVQILSGLEAGASVLLYNPTLPVESGEAAGDSKKKPPAAAAKDASS